LSTRFRTSLQSLAALALVLAGSAAQATGYHLILDKDAPHGVLVTIRQPTSRLDTYRVTPGMPLEIKKDHIYVFQFKDKLDPTRRCQEVTFQLHQAGETEAVSQFQYWSGMPPQTKVGSHPLSGHEAFKRFQGVTEDEDTWLSWRGGSVAWAATMPPYTAVSEESKSVAADCSSGTAGEVPAARESKTGKP